MSETISCLLIGWEQAKGGAHRENCCGLHPTITPRCWHSSHWGNNRVYLLQMLPYLHFFFWLTSKNAEQWLNLLLATDRNLSYQACIGPRHLLLVFFVFFAASLGSFSSLSLQTLPFTCLDSLSCLSSALWGVVYQCHSALSSQQVFWIQTFFNKRAPLGTLLVVVGEEQKGRGSIAKISIGPRSRL